MQLITFTVSLAFSFNLILDNAEGLATPVFKIKISFNKTPILDQRNLIFFLIENLIFGVSLIRRTRSTFENILSQFSYFLSNDIWNDFAANPSVNAIKSNQRLSIFVFAGDTLIKTSIEVVQKRASELVDLQRPDLTHLP